MEILPDEVKLNILKNMSAEELSRNCQISVEFRNLCQDDSLWKRLVIDKFGEVAIINNSWYQTYQYFNKYDKVYLLIDYDEFGETDENYHEIFGSVEVAINYMINSYPLFLVRTSHFYDIFFKKYPYFDRNLMSGGYIDEINNSHPQYNDFINIYRKEFHKYLNEIAIYNDEYKTYKYKLEDMYRVTKDYYKLREIKIIRK